MREEFVGWVECEDGIDLLRDTKFDWHVVLDHDQPIIRCRDCKWYYEAKGYHPNGNYDMRCCKYFDTYNDEVDPDGFCAWASPREEGE